MIDVHVQVGDKVFAAGLVDNASARALAAQFPMTLTMRELNGNEKYFNLATRLPSEPQRVKSVEAGDLMLYGADCLVLFYKRFRTSYSYTALGRLEDASGLVDALGRGDVQVTLSLAA